MRGSTTRSVSDELVNPSLKSLQVSPPSVLRNKPSAQNM